MQCNAMQCNAMQCNAMQCNRIDVYSHAYNNIDYDLKFKGIKTPIRLHLNDVLFNGVNTNFLVISRHNYTNTFNVLM